jgi:perosamine synthetase
MTPRLILDRPYVAPHRCRGPVTPGMAAALELAPRRYHFSRDALHALFRAFGYPAGTPVWMPSFHCGMEVRAAADAGLSPRFYRVHADLSIDEDQLAGALRRAPGPVLLIHYFGFPQPGIRRLAALCREQGVPLVEDASHAFLSEPWETGGNALGSLAPAATFSLYKVLGTADGGALRVDESEIRRLTGRPFRLSPPGPRPLVPWAELRQIERRRQGHRGRGHAELAAIFAQRAAAAEGRIFAGPWRYGREISHLSLALLRRLDPAAIRERRRRNYLRLAARLAGAPGFRPVMESLRPGVCPLYLPVFVRHRTEILLRLQAAGVETFLFGIFHHPALDAARFPEARTLREEILCLPIHQDLEAADLDRLAALLEPLLTGSDPVFSKGGSPPWPPSPLSPPPPPAMTCRT